MRPMRDRQATRDLIPIAGSFGLGVLLAVMLDVATKEPACAPTVFEEKLSIDSKGPRRGKFNQIILGIMLFMLCSYFGSVYRLFDVLSVSKFLNGKLCEKIGGTI